MRRTFKQLAVVAVGLALFAAACGDDDSSSSATTTAAGGGEQLTGSITIGSANFNEQELVAEMVAQVLASKGVDVTKKLKLGAREVVAPALEKGDIDAEVEYVGSYLTYLGGQPTSNVDTSLTDLQAKLEPKGLTALKPAPAQDQNAFVVTKATADKYNLKTISDLAKVTDRLTLGGPPECPQRPLCLQGLQKTYGLNDLQFKALDTGGPLTVAALDNGDIQLALLFSSDGTIAQKGWVILEDDKSLQPADNLVVVGKKDKLPDDYATVLDAVLAKLTTEQLQQLNVRMNVDKEEPAAVAKQWLQDNGFLS